MEKIKFVGNHIEVEPPKKPKKITGTWLASCLGVNPFKTDFELWCRCTRTYEIPFEGNKFTHAGEVIEPKVFDFLRESLGYGDRVITPENVWGKNAFKATWGDFYKTQEVFGGMWDALIYDEDYGHSEHTRPEYVVEIKTVQVDGHSGSLENRWRDGKAPDYQALQAALYAYLLGVNKVMMVAVALEDGKGDYEHPENVTPSFANGNVYIDTFDIFERYPNFEEYIVKAVAWWNAYVVTGISPDFDEKKDAELLKAIRTNSVDPTGDLAELLAEIEKKTDEIEELKKPIADKEKDLKTLKEVLKERMTEMFHEGETKVECKSNNYVFTLSRTTSTEIDKTALKKAGLLEAYSKPKITERLTSKKIENEA